MHIRVAGQRAPVQVGGRGLGGERGSASCEDCGSTGSCCYTCKIHMMFMTVVYLLMMLFNVVVACICVGGVACSCVAVSVARDEEDGCPECDR